MGEVSSEYLKIATLAEINLIRQEYDEAGRLYKKAIVLDPEAIGLHQEFLAESRRLMEALDTASEDRLRIEQILVG